MTENIMNELDKIGLLFDESKRMKSANEQWIMSIDFFALWRNMCQPKPFLLEGDSFKLFNRKISIPENERNIACLEWDSIKNAPVMRLESGEVSTELVLGFDDDNNPTILDRETSVVKGRELSYGEKLEIVYDVVEFVRKYHAGQDVRKFTKKTLYRDIRGRIGGTLSRRHGAGFEKDQARASEKDDK